MRDPMNGVPKNIRDQLNAKMRQNQSRFAKRDPAAIVDPAAGGSVKPFARKTQEELLEIRARCTRDGSDVLKREYGDLRLQLAVEHEVVRAFQTYVRELEAEIDRLTVQSPDHEIIASAPTRAHSNPDGSLRDVVDGDVIEVVPTEAVTETDRV